LQLKINRRSETRRKQGNKTFHPWFITLRSLFAYFRSYIFRAGFLDGWQDLVIAWNEVDHVFYNYMKRYVDKVIYTEKNE
jgi:hypothetical protein